MTFSRKMVWARATSSIRCPSAGEAVKPEVDGVSGLGRLADLAQLLEAANPRSLPGTRIDDEDGALRLSISTPSGGITRSSE
jgi:hypothetical protein